MKLHILILKQVFGDSENCTRMDFLFPPVMIILIPSSPKLKLTSHILLPGPNRKNHWWVPEKKFPQKRHNSRHFSDQPNWILWSMCFCHLWSKKKTTQYFSGEWIFFHFLHCSYENLLKAYVTFGHAGIVCLRVKLMMKSVRQRLTKVRPYLKCQLNISRHIICGSWQKCWYSCLFPLKWQPSALTYIDTEKIRNRLNKLTARLQLWSCLKHQLHFNQ